jgi:hypothetical protein
MKIIWVLINLSTIDPGNDVTEILPSFHSYAACEVRIDELAKDAGGDDQEAWSKTRKHFECRQVIIPAPPPCTP